MPTRLIADALPDVMDCARLEVIAGAGHMGPMTHADAVSARIVAHIAERRSHAGPARADDAPAASSAWMPPDRLQRKTGRGCGPFQIADRRAPAYGNFQ